MDSIELNKRASSRHQVATTQYDTQRSGVLVEAPLEMGDFNRSPGFCSGDELTDDEAEAFFFV